MRAKSGLPILEIRQAIQTKYVNPTCTKGARIQAKAYAGSKFYSWDHSLNIDENHYCAALKFAQLKGWSNAKDFKLAGGSLRDGSYAWITNAI